MRYGVLCEQSAVKAEDFNGSDSEFFSTRKDSNDKRGEVVLLLIEAAVDVNRDVRKSVPQHCEQRVNRHCESRKHKPSSKNLQELINGHKSSVGVWEKVRCPHSLTGARGVTDGHKAPASRTD